MSKIRLYGATSGFVELQAPAVASDSTVTLPNGPFDFEAGFRYVGTRYYTSDGTFAKADPFGDSSFDGAKMRAIRARMVGGGGGGAGTGTATGVGQGGGGGAYAESFLTDIAGLSSSVAVTRGGGGSGGAAGNNNGSNGGASSFGALVSADGGLGGESPAGAFKPNTGGVSAVGQIMIAGGNSGTRIPSGGTASSGGGNSMFGFGGATVGAPDIAGSDAPRTGFGSGGSGSITSGTARSGTAGGNGIVIIDIFA